ncbi:MULTISPECIES: hypothetical protein [Clostridium]|uniref:DUF559 domain-containing protein n=1 Tax=Clostridium frigoriphilum TaxID=443253 RepID=A0ABU7UHQ9_9CLOT|nr:hypothetical protein [Clostridium sp. DSM 17811]MBU3098414.1 hypothetical protein [Clostridium sp. DSM 17811]
MIKKFTCIKELEEIKCLSQMKHHVEEQSGYRDKLNSLLYGGYNEELEIECSCGNVYKATAYEYLLYYRRCNKCTVYVKSNNAIDDNITRTIRIPIRNNMIQVLRQDADQTSFVNGMQFKIPRLIWLDGLADIQSNSSGRLSMQVTYQQCFNQCKKRKSKYEKIVSKELTRRGLIFKEEKSIWFEMKSYQFDFWVLDSEGKIKFFIEIDGELHFRDCFKKKRLLYQQLNDQKKNEVCQRSNTSLIRIPYWEIQFIDKILDEKLDFKYAKESKLNKAWNGFDLNED